ncbi:SigE family RNA polymerase sigma factor [Actinomadura verrucosospora]|uniref:ECF subfamily RNA polymerase sigma-24 subunit n=1 Tax=Actinomadura verrucosospora TaxID=46165 RepID=A0A7D3W057_ACTVE|nr:SigE family RNA polymerase sigma factor [Actinomadura verrucosospora]QKG25234.1 ECF subfamily RNA polymerase sigma-24 subunit [Actinomadura verrucosospora]
MNREARESFTRFVAARSSRLIRTAYVLTGDQHAAEDLLQTALTKTAARWRHVGANPEGYVRRAMYHEQVNRWRRRGREAAVAVVPDRPVGDRAGEVDLRLALEKALLVLPPRKRAVLVLRYFEDLPEGEVAEILGCSVGTVRSQTHRAIARLRELVPDLAAQLENAGGAE